MLGAQLVGLLGLFLRPLLFHFGLLPGAFALELLRLLLGALLFGLLPGAFAFDVLRLLLGAQLVGLLRLFLRPQPFHLGLLPGVLAFDLRRRPFPVPGRRPGRLAAGGRKVHAARVPAALRAILRQDDVAGIGRRGGGGPRAGERQADCQSPCRATVHSASPFIAHAPARGSSVRAGRCASFLS